MLMWGANLAMENVTAKKKRKNNLKSKIILKQLFINGHIKKN